VKRRNAVVLAKKSQEIDLEYCMFDIVEGKTYEDDGTTVFDVYINAGLQDGSFEKATPPIGHDLGTSSQSLGPSDPVQGAIRNNNGGVRLDIYSTDSRFLIFRVGSSTFIVRPIGSVVLIFARFPIRAAFLA
jgi:hypothetical protein